MNKILRYSFVALLAMIGFGNAMAEDVIWSEDFSSYKADDVPSDGTYNYVCTDNGTNATKIYEANLAQGESPELLVGKKNTKAKNPDVLGTFAATVNLGDKSGDMTLSFKANGKLTVTIEGGTIGDNTGTGNDYVYPITGASGKLTITFTNNTTSNIRLDNIKLAQGETKKPAGLTWGTSSRTVTIGADDNTFPTLSNENNLAVTYDSSDKTVATIAADGTITLVADGETTITATSEETEEFEAGHAEYKLTVKPALVYKNFVKATTIESGKNYLLVVNVGEDGLKAAKKITANYGNLLVADATETEGKISFVIDNAFTFTSTENGWTIMQSDGKYLYQSGDYNNFNVNAAPTSGQYFDVEALEGGTFKITNKEKSKFIQYVPANTNIGCFAEAQEGAILPMLYAEEAAVTKYTITITNTEHGSLTLDKYEAAAGEKVNVTDMSTDAGWEMNQPTITAENGEEVEIGGSDEEGHYIIMPASNVTIALNITQLFTINPVFDSNKGDVRGISFDSEKSPIYKGAGKNVKFTVTAKEGFEVESVTAACEDNTPITVNVAADNSYYEFQMPAKNVTITATFSPVSGSSNITAAKAENAVRYNLAGQKVNAGYKGVVIMNGKKMLQK